MKTSRAAIRYAKALMLEAIENNSLEKMFKDVGFKVIKIESQKTIRRRNNLVALVKKGEF